MRERLFWCDVARASACVFVVLLHASGIVLYRYGKIPDPDWWLGNVIDSLTRPAVPVFFMLSGALTFGRISERGTDWRAVWARLSRILWPLLFYSLVAVAYAGVVDHQRPGSYSLPVWQQFYHLWFFYSMAGVVVIAAFLRPVAIPPGQAVALLFAALMLAGGGLDAFLGKTDISILNGLPVYFIYFLLGHYCAGLDEKVVRRFCWPALLLFLLASLWLIWLTGLRSEAKGGFDEIFYGYNSLPVVVQALSLFLFLRAISPVVERQGRVVTAVGSISRLSLGIYGFHPFVLGVLHHTGVTGSFQPTALEITMRFVIAFAVSYALTALLRATLDRKGVVT